MIAAKNPPGVSVVIVTYNGERRLGETLNHLSLQKVDKGLHWEVVVVDNASDDDTSGFVKRTWKSGIPMKLVREKGKGVGIARIRGIEESKFEFILFVDDDNWIRPYWVQRVYSILISSPEIGVIGGNNAGSFESEIPAWFEPIRGSFAIGPQADETADITDTRGYVWGAGMGFRKSVYLHFRDCGFVPLLKGRKPGKLSAGEDVELCFLFRAAGYRIWYFSDLMLTHYMPQKRISWQYCKALYYATGESVYFLDLYCLSMKNTKSPFFISLKNSIEELFYVLLTCTRDLFNAAKRKQDYLLLLYTLSRLSTTITEIANFRSYYRQINDVIQKLKSGN